MHSRVNARRSNMPRLNASILNECNEACENAVGLTLLTKHEEISSIISTSSTSSNALDQGIGSGFSTEVDSSCPLANDLRNLNI